MGGTYGQSGQGNYGTAYNYDVLDDLTSVTQASQTPRTFTYDTLKRLVQASNPESGTFSYLYDASGNLATRTDPRILPGKMCIRDRDSGFDG